MNSLKTIALFGVIFGLAMGALSISGVSGTSFMTASVPQAQDRAYMVGHVETTVMGPDGNVKGYFQSDNQVVNEGVTCVAHQVFNAHTDNAAGTTLANPCGFDAGGFQYIAIGNGTDGTVAATDTDFDTTGTNTGQVLTRIQDTAPVVGTASGGQVTVEVETPTAFSFDATVGSTNIEQAALFNQSATSGDLLFAIQALNPTSGIAVTSGDSLSVKWTITVG